MNFYRRISLVGAVLALAALALFFATKPDAANPALWRVDGPQGQRAWLFGTIHALPRPARWRTEPVQTALGEADRLVVEVAALDDQAGMARAFESVAHSKGLPPLDQRVEPALRPRLRAALAKLGKNLADFADTETWAAGLMLARGEDIGDPANGVDRGLLAERGALPVVELEGAEAQFALFDHLPEAAQRHLLAEALRGADGDPAALAQGWRKGDMAMLDAQTRQGLLADPALREALYTGRNRAWSQSITAIMRSGGRPFVAVGAAHMAGAQGLPAMLAAKGYRVTRVQ